MGSAHKLVSSFQIIILGFAAVIFLGCLMLMLPIATQNGAGANFLEALFTATSAVCVTGLVVQDTATYWSGFGQLIIILLIQIGGMGVVTVAVALYAFSGRKISIKQLSTLQEAIAAPQIGGMAKLAGFILRIMLILELIGAVFLAPTFCQEFGLGKGIAYSLFHSVSAFCNAGFDLMGCQTPYSSLTSFVDRPTLNITIMALIILGGLGFLTWDDFKTHRHHWKRYRMQSKVILTTTAVLIILPALYFFWVEFSSAPWPERILSSLFQSVTPRTAGFNTADLTLFSEVSWLLMIMLMLVGGSPGSTAGGMKVTTLAVLLATALAVFKRREHPQFFGRRIADSTVRTAATILMSYLGLFLLGGLAISYLEKLPLLTCLYETASAIGTVGLSLGITPKLGALSQAILIVLMFLGRVGGLTLIFAALPSQQKLGSKLPLEKITVG